MSPNTGGPKYIREILVDFKKDIDSNTIKVGDFDTPLSKMDRSSKQNINKDIAALNNVLDQMDVTRSQTQGKNSKTLKLKEIE